MIVINLKLGSLRRTEFCARRSGIGKAERAYRIAGFQDNKRKVEGRKWSGSAELVFLYLVNSVNPV